MQKILITGAAGNIGKALRAGLKSTQFHLRLGDIVPIKTMGKNEEVVHLDITNFLQVKNIMDGIDCVVHLAGIPLEDTWEKVLQANIIGTRNIFEAAKQAGVKRVIFASSNHVIGFYRNNQVIDENVPPRPDSLYGVSKVFGESLGRYYADKYGLSVACIRIGSFEKKPFEKRHLRTWVSENDLIELIKRCIEAPEYHYLVVYGVSDNKQKLWRDNAANILGYHAKDNAELYIEHLSLTESTDVIADQFHGGSFCSADFDSDASKIK